MLSSGALLCVVLLIVAIWQYLKARLDVFKKLDIKNPKPHLLFGNLKQLKVKFYGDVFVDWTKEFGSIYGYFEGGAPVLVVSDLDALQEIFIKQFWNFDGRKLLPLQQDPDTAKNVNLFFARGIRWKRLRNISNPTFTSLKLKQMMPIITECINQTLHVLDEKFKSDQPFNIHSVYQGLTLDVIARTAFGYETSVQNNPDDPLLDVCRNVFQGSKTTMSRYLNLAGSTIHLVFPELWVVWRLLAKLTVAFRRVPSYDLKQRMKVVVEERRKLIGSSKGPKDFIQLMLEAESNEDLLNTTESKRSIETVIEKKLNAEEIVEQSFLFILAGFETTSITLAFATYLLATHPKEFEKLLAEIDTLEKNAQLTYEMIKKLTYLDMVIKETLRLYPIGAFVINRRCVNACTINGLHIPAEMNVMPDVMKLHFSEEYWGENPKEFDPERFSPENSANRNPLVYMPFGIGPRICVGMRFGLLEAKMALIKILQNFKFVTCSETQIPLQMGFPGAGFFPQKGIVIRLERRL